MPSLSNPVQPWDSNQLKQTHAFLQPDQTGRSTGRFSNYPLATQPREYEQPEQYSPSYPSYTEPSRFHAGRPSWIYDQAPVGFSQGQQLTSSAFEGLYISDQASIGRSYQATVNNPYGGSGMSGGGSGSYLPSSPSQGQQSATNQWQAPPDTYYPSQHDLHQTQQHSAYGGYGGSDQTWPSNPSHGSGSAGKKTTGSGGRSRRR